MANPFQTPPNEQSFSSLIDEAILATGKPGSLLQAVSAANVTIKECQALGLFARDLVEGDPITGAPFTVDSVPFTWTRPPFFRILRTVKYLNCCVYPKLRLPGRVQEHERHYFYAANNYYVFSGAVVGEQIATAAYFWAVPLSYYGRLGVSTALFPGGPYPIRPAYFDITTMVWKYLNADSSAYVLTTGDPVEDANRQRLASNWLVADWRDLILSGVKTMLWNSTGDPRGQVEYSKYKQLQKTLQITSEYEATGY